MMDDTQGQERRKSLYLASQFSGLSQLRVSVGLLLAVTIFLVTAVGIAQADDQSSPTIAVGYQNGTITAIHEKALDIDGRTYSVTPDVVMLDDFGRMLDPARLVVSAEVKFHVRKEQNNTIEKMIVKLPR